MTDDFPTMEELLNQIQEETGLIFQKNEPNQWSEFEWYTAKDRGAKYDVHYSTYSDTTRRFISVGWDYKLAGGGCPCDSVEEAINRIKGYMDRVEKDREILKPKKQKKEEYQQMSIFDYLD